MNDALRFRVWDKVFNYYWTEEVIKENAGWLLFPDNNNINDVDIEKYIGIADDNGKLIYENDFVLLNGEIWQVIWVEEDCAFFLSNLKETYHQPIYPDLYNYAEDFEVVGNVHETPELLK